MIFIHHHAKFKYSNKITVSHPMNYVLPKVMHIPISKTHESFDKRHGHNSFTKQKNSYVTKNLLFMYYVLLNSANGTEKNS